MNLHEVRARLDRPIPGPMWLHRALARWILPGVVVLAYVTFALTSTAADRPPLWAVGALGAALFAATRTLIRAEQRTASDRA